MNDARAPSRRSRVIGGLLLFLGIGASVFWWRPAGQPARPTDKAGTTHAVVVPSLPTVPSSTINRPAPALAAQYERVDPRKDGWETEAFSEEADAQLKRLGKLLVNPAKFNAEQMAELVADRFVCEALRPNALQEVFTDQRATVYRKADSDRDPASEQMNLTDAIAGLRAPYDGATDLRVKFKIFRVNTTATFGTTSARFEASGRSANGTIQQTAVWHCRWLPGKEGDGPRLDSIRVELFEEVVNRQKRGKWFADCTQAVFGKNRADYDQLLYGIDHWRSRIDASLGIHVLGHHGMTVGDVNGDGLDDLYLCRAGGLPNVLLVQNKDGTVTNTSNEAGVDWLESSQSGLFIDLDNDGDEDLVVGFGWGLMVLSNDGSGHFSPVFRKGMSSRPMSLSAADFDDDGDLDLYLCLYGPEMQITAEGVGATRVGPAPYHDANNGGRNMLLRNEGDWQFLNVSSLVGLDTNNYRFSFAAAWEDYDNDGDQDLYVANDFGRNNLYRNDGGHFQDVAGAAGVEDIAAGMSVSWGDFNNDGLMDLYVGNMFSSAGNRITADRNFRTESAQPTRALYQRHARGNSLFENAGDGTFRDVSIASAVTMGRWAWSSVFVDVNNDGLEDIFVSNGYVTQTDTGDL